MFHLRFSTLLTTLPAALFLLLFPFSTQALTCNQIVSAQCTTSSICDQYNRIDIGSDPDCEAGKICCLPSSCTGANGTCRLGTTDACNAGESRLTLSGCEVNEKCCVAPRASAPPPPAAPPQTCEDLNGYCESELAGGCNATTHDNPGRINCEFGQTCCVPKSGTPTPPAPSSGAATGTAQATVERTGFGLLNPFGSRSVPVIIGDLIGWLGGLAGSAFFLYLLWGGFEWMLAGGNETQVKNAINKIIYSSLGIVIIIVAYFIVDALIGLVNVPL